MKPVWEAEAFVRTAAASLPADIRPELHTGPIWTTVRPPGVELPGEGWKLHVSARRGNFPAVAEIVVPILLAQRCHFKLARSTAVLAGLNEGLQAAAGVGKAFTIYPTDTTVADLGHRLSEALDGIEGPRILSDRRITDRAPVYYRYGPFVSRWYAGDRGALAIQLHGPGGETFDGIATLEYRQPSWVTDPFITAGTATQPSADTMVGDHYRIDRGIYKAAKGNVFRGVDIRTGRQVIVKQARAHVGESSEGSDTRSRLRNERRILQALAGLAGVPEFLDHFAHGDDEFLVTGDAGERNLLEHTLRYAAYRPGGDAARDRFARLATGLAGVVRELHRRGVIMRDITPRNVVMNGDHPALVDFGIASLDDFWLPGGTPGFAPDRQFQGSGPVEFDDCFALGMTLGFAATGMTPVAGSSDARLPAQRMRQSLLEIHGPGSDQLDLVSALLDEETAADTLEILAKGESAPMSSRPLPDLPRVTPADVADLVTITLDQILERVEEHQLAEQSAFQAVDSSIYTGSSGVGLELLHHLDHPGVAETVLRLAEHAVRARARVQLAPGLYVGLTGVDLFLARAAEHGIEVPTPGQVEHSEPADGDDILYGAAGVGLGHLLLYDLTGEPEQLDLARDRARAFLDDRELRLTERDPNLPIEAAVDGSCGYAHGIAGVLDFLLAYAVRTGDQAGYDAAARLARELRDRVADLTRLAVGRLAVPLCVSWCQGLAGIAPVLQRAAAVLDDATLGHAAVDVAGATAAWIPWLGNVSQCCGATGVGSMYAELAVMAGEERYHKAAYDVASHLLVRSHGPDDAPVFVNPGEQDAPLSWGQGNTGILAFLRHLRDSERETTRGTGRVVVCHPDSRG